MKETNDEHFCKTPIFQFQTLTIPLFFECRPYHLFCFTFTFNSDGIVVVHSECRQMTIWLGFIWNKERMQPDGLCQNREERWAGLALMGSWDYLVKWVRCCSVVLSSRFPNFPVRNRHAERISPRSWPCTWRVSGWNIVKIQDDTVVYLMTSLPVADLPQIWSTQSFSDSELKDDYHQVLLLLYCGLYRRWSGWASSAAQTWSGSAMRAGLVSCIWTGDLLTDNKDLKKKKKITCCHGVQGISKVIWFESERTDTWCPWWCGDTGET